MRSRFSQAASDQRVFSLAVPLLILVALSVRGFAPALVAVNNETAVSGLTAVTALSFDGWDWPLAGPQTGEVRSSAFFVTLLAAAYTLWWDHHAGVICIALLNTVAVYLVYRFCRDRFGAVTAFWASMLYATSPWAVLYSRYLVPVSCLAAFGAALIHISVRWVETGGRFRLAVMLMLGLLLPQIHFSGLSATLWLFVVLYHGRQHLSLGPCVAGVLSGLLLWVPWVAFQIINKGDEIRASLSRIVSGDIPTSSALTSAVYNLQCCLGYSNMEYWFGDGAKSVVLGFPDWQISSLAVISGIFAFVMLAAVTKAILLDPFSGSGSLLVTWIAIPVLLLTICRFRSTPDSLLIAYPAPYLLIAWLWSCLRVRATRAFRVAAGCICLCTLTLNLWFLASVSMLIGDGLADGGGAFGLSYGQRKAVLESVLADSGQNPVRIVGPYSAFYPAFEFVNTFEGTGTVLQADSAVAYWLEEHSSNDSGIEAGRSLTTERRINAVLSQYLRSRPDWVIEKQWRIQHTQVIRLRYVSRQELR